MDNLYLDSSYQPILVVLSFALATMASYAALGLGARLPHVKESQFIYWLTGGALAMGIGIWSMHFVGMLAFHLPIPLAYDFTLTFVSIIIAILASGTALYVIRRGISGHLQLAISSIVMGGGISGMHYTGMAALKMFPAIEYHPPLVVASIVIAITASYFALQLSFAGSRQRSFIFSPLSLISALIMGIAIAGMHYVAMFAARFPAGSVCMATQSGLDTTLLAVATTLSSMLILTIAIMVLIYDVRMAAKDAILLDQLQRKNEELELRAIALANKMTEQIRSSAEKDRLLAAIIEQAGTAIFTTDRDGVITSWNQGAERLLKYHGKEAIHIPFIELVKPDTGDDAYLREEQPYSVNERFVRLVRKDSSTCYVDMITSHLYDNDEQVIGDVHIVHDVTGEKDAYDDLLLMREVFYHSGEAILITDSDNRIISINDAFTEVTGYGLDEVVGHYPSILQSGIHDQAFYKELWRQLNEYDFWRGEIWNRRKNGEIYPQWLTITILRDHTGRVRHYIANFTDVSQYKAREAEIEYLAHHDTLTKLPNRLLLRNRLEQAIAHARRNSTHIAVMFLDLDRFKLINDSLGHDIGDQVLIAVTERLQKIIRDEDIISRQGGDEFIIVLNEISDNSTIMELAERIIDTINKPIEINSHNLTITPSIGISLYPDDSENIDELIRNADTAMYHAKELGRATYQFFTESLNAEIKRRLDIENRLRQALESKAFTLHYQPQHDLSDGRMTGAEVLLRYTPDNNSSMRPDDFIPIAEETGLIIPLGEWVVREVCRQIDEWRRQNLKIPRLSINVSARQLDDGTILDVLHEVLEHYQINTQLIELELTESAVMKNPKRSLERMHQLQMMHISIAIDDFGTGYSSLSYLQRLPINVLKIDRSFIKEIEHSKSALDLTQAVINLANGLELKTVAEGIETREQLDYLTKAGCTMGQGYYFSRPMDAEAFSVYMQQQLS